MEGVHEKVHHFILSILICLSSFLSTTSYAYDQGESSAILAAETFLEIVDAGKYENSWEASTTYLKARHPKDYYIAFVGTTRSAFGSLINRSIISAKLYDKFFGYPDGNICDIRFESSFENKAVGREILTLILNAEGHWKVVKYTVG